VTGFSLSDILGLRKPKNVKFGINIAVAKIAKYAKTPEKAKKRAHSFTAETTNSRNAEIGKNVADGLEMMPELSELSART